MAQESGSGGSGMLGRLTGGGGGRSSFVYVVVGVVALTLTILLLIIYFSASERERTSPPICTDITMERAERAVLAGEVERLTIVHDETPQTPTSGRYGPVLAKLDFVDGSCSNLPQGVANQDTVYTIAGVIAFYNENTEEQKVEITYQTGGRLDDELFARPTEPPTATATAAPTEPPTATPSPTATPVRGTPVATPLASPAARATATPSPTPTPTEVSLP